MAEIDIRGVIASNDDAWIYRWFGYEATSPADVTRVLQEAGGEEVVVRINSYGGDVWSASEIYTSLRAYTGPIITVVTGLAASAASVILMAGKPVRASPTAEIMIHNPSMQAEGDYREMERARKELINTRNAILNAYELKTGLTRSTLRQMMDRPAWMTAQTAKRRGFIDEVLFAGAIWRWRKARTRRPKATKALLPVPLLCRSRALLFCVRKSACGTNCRRAQRALPRRGGTGRVYGSTIRARRSGTASKMRSSAL